MPAGGYAMGLAGLAINELAQRCADNTERFRKRQSHDFSFCYELLRRALLEERSEAFTHVYRIYETQVRRWVYRHDRFSQTGESAEYFASWRLAASISPCVAANRAIAHLSQLLSYLKACVHTAIVGYLRDKLPLVTISLEEVQIAGPEPGLENTINAAQLWDHVCNVLVDDNDRLLAHDESSWR